MFQFSGSHGAKICVRQQAHQRFDVVAAMHVAQQFDGGLFINHRTASFARQQCRQEASLDIGGLVYARRNAGADQF